MEDMERFEKDGINIVLKDDGDDLFFLVISKGKKTESIILNCSMERAMKNYVSLCEVFSE